ncbi:mechanosensitive ion channel family protein [Deinococcus murrayi]|uniref:mechanosensitive ion channel family protein n=1 Tax=Deinococcus murrayi TaxID=68910 RepID=UPI00068467B6|nr:mechanosensitive ion channel family protein [Deinococcus murrayi]
MNLTTEVAWTRLQATLQGLVAALPNVLLATLVFLVFVLVARWVGRAVGTVAARAGQEPGVSRVFSRLASWGVLAFGLLVALTILIPSLNAASLFSALGVGGVAIGFAFKDIFQNLLAGLLLLVTRPFRIGDQIISGSHEGTVEDIQVRATLLRTYDNRRVVIPNSELYTNRVVVNTAHDRLRLAVAVGIGYGDDIPKAKRIILNTLAQVEGVRTDPPPTVLVREYGDFSVNLEVRFWIDPPIRREAVEVQDRVLEALKPALLSAGIDLPFPTQQVLFHNQTEETDGDRTRQREGWPAPPQEAAAGSRQPAAGSQRPAGTSEELRADS